MKNELRERGAKVALSKGMPSLLSQIFGKTSEPKRRFSNIEVEFSPIFFVRKTQNASAGTDLRLLRAVAYFCRLNFLNMKKRLSLLPALVFAAFFAAAQGIEFFHGTFAEALEKAKTEEKLVFIDCFTEWCGPCKRMAATTFKDAEVGAFFNENFINLKIDMEKGEGPELSSKFSITAYPTLVFVNFEGKTQKKQVGGQAVDGLLALGRGVLGKNDAIQNYEKMYEEEGKRDAETVLGYVKSLNRAGKPSLKISNDYLKTQTDLTSEFNLKFIFEAATEADSRIFDLLIQNRALIEKIEKPVLVENKIEKCCAATAKKAVNFRSKELLAEAQSKAKQHVPSRAEAFVSKTNLEFSIASKDINGFLAQLKKREKAAGNDASKLNDIASDAVKNFGDNAKALKMAEKCQKKAAQNGGLAEYWLSLSDIQHRLKKKKDALASLGKAKSIAQEKKPGLVPQIDQMIESINAGE